MLTRALLPRAPLRALPRLYRPYATGQSNAPNQVPANDPAQRTPPPNVSETNATALSSEGSMDKVLQESVERAEAMRTAQAPNRKGIWSRSQQPRGVAMSGPRFEQTIMEDQVCLILCN